MKSKTTPCRIMSSQLAIAKEIKSMLLKGHGLNDVVKNYLPEYINDEGSTLLIENAKALKKKNWSSVFDATIRLPDQYVDEIITILYELDRKANNIKKTPSNQEAVIIKILANTIKAIERSELAKQHKNDLIYQVSNIKLKTG